ncbi:MAG: hypothetical protein A2275_02850 [Bacteroidetes bacterium RIFOXYA12_FULL_35_11]|nr:MAG: hypothetical protein A2X01_19325 [Bacteroidetes bacterium GWF2_35_48]OFY75083.1 MAG: hypothetical protein A2275_02850 [Bacteroidetes bacterium RIFOXYA12_FULL_35_11]OFY97892.1 MAG: hypothetical protein A2309_01850 [Bacteroidetes bacterium RIFOXYB2_FULL_35_7]OFY99878.1 MAG: hypothetical protein A2491_01255 [Bacteroidetes bacterium RIFOXYC12_FULL_35_7]HBX50682.1 hypothetical protein [Bacteroidales bacterium]
MIKKSNILIVDDSVLVLLGLNKTLLNNNLNAFMASDGKKALEILNKEKIDLVLLDLLMPGIDGYEILDFMKTNDKFKNIPVLVLSSVQEDEEIEKARNKGATEFLHKPILPKELIRHINKALK